MGRRLEFRLICFGLAILVPSEDRGQFEFCQFDPQKFQDSGLVDIHLFANLGGKVRLLQVNFPIFDTKVQSKFAQVLLIGRREVLEHLFARHKFDSGDGRFTWIGELGMGKGLEEELGVLGAFICEQ